MSEEYIVLIIESSSGAVEKAMKVTGYRRAERVERGAQINLNHALYHTEIIRADELRSYTMRPQE